MYRQISIASFIFHILLFVSFSLMLEPKNVISFKNGHEVFQNVFFVEIYMLT